MTLLAILSAAALLYLLRRHRRHRAVRGRSRALLLVVAIVGLNLGIGTPAMAQGTCAEAPSPERPGAGMVGAIDPPQGNGEKGSPYLNYGYAGMVWHIYDNNCGPLSNAVTDPGTTIDTWAGNELFSIAKNIVGATNSLHYTLLNGGLFGGLTQAIHEAAGAVFANVFMQLFSLFMLLLALALFRHIWRGDLAGLSRRTLFAFGGIWLAASTPVVVNGFAVIDDAIVKTTTGIQAGFVDPERDRVIRDVLPTDLHTKVVYDNWLRGEFGKPDAPEATRFGPRLLEAQAWTWEDVRTGRDADNATENAKKEDYKRIAGELGPATGYFKGTDGSRVGAGFLAVLQSIAYSLFPLFAKLAVLLAQLLLRIFALTAPIIGLVALINQHILRRVGKALGAITLNVLVIAMLAGVHFKFLQLIFSPNAGLSLLTQMLVAGIVTLIFLLVGRPIRRIWQMIETSVEAAGTSIPSPRGGLFSRFRWRKLQEPTPQDTFWDNLKDSDSGADRSPTAGSTRRPRPEADQPATVTATAQRVYTRGPSSGRSPGAAPSPSGAPAPYRPVVVNRPGRDVVVPSRLARPVEQDAPGPQPAHREEVNGRPVTVTYRPSRGLQLGPAQQPPSTDIESAVR